MEAFLEFFETIPSTYRSLILASGLMLFWLIEGAFPFFKFSYRRYRHAGLNMVFTLTTLIVNLSFAFLIIWAADTVQVMEVGAMQWFSTPLWLSILIGILVLDFISAWLVHFVEHKVKWLWKFHLIHHTDRSVDVTTALRHHPGESIFRAIGTVLAVFLAGTPIAVVFIYQSLSALFSQFNHANIHLPKALDRFLSWFIVTPDMHKVHHHYVQPLTDTNYGNIFSIWDRMFRTFAEVPDASTLTFGIDTHMDPNETDRAGNLMAIPFQDYRPPSGSKFSELAEPDGSGETNVPNEHDRRGAAN